MKQHEKPVHGCYGCFLNLEDHCWLYRYPRGQWKDGRHCPGRDDDALHERFRQWQKEPDVRTRKDLRKDFFRTRKRTVVNREPKGLRH